MNRVGFTLAGALFNDRKSSCIASAMLKSLEATKEVRNYSKIICNFA